MPANPTDRSNGTQSDNGWSQAIEFAQLIAPISATLPALMRSLLTDDRENQGQLSAVTKYTVGRICCASSFKAMLYYCTEVVEPEFLRKNKSIAVGELIDLYTPADLSAIIAAFSLGKIIRKRVPPELFERVRPYLAREAHVGLMAGLAVPHLGLAPGVLLGTLPHIGHALMSASDPSLYKQWRRSLTGTSFDERTKREQELWGCSSAQVGAMILIRLGFPTQSAQALAFASESTAPVKSIRDLETRNVRISLLWLECLLNGQETPKDVLPGDCFPFEGIRAGIDASIKQLTSPDQSWLERSGEDISPERTPQLFTKPPVKSAALEVSPQLAEIFSVESLTKMGEAQFDSLVNHLDKEIADGKIDPHGNSKDANEIEDALS